MRKFLSWLAASLIAVLLTLAPVVGAQETPDGSGANAQDIITPTPGASSQAVEEDPICIEKIRTFDVPTNGEKYIMEVGGVYTQMVEQFVDLGEPTVVFLVAGLAPRESAARWEGWGSTWEETGLPGCEQFDSIENARRYVADRASREESVTGLVVDLRGEDPVLVYNFFDDEPDDVLKLLEEISTDQGEDAPDYSSLVFAADAQALCIDSSFAPIPGDPWVVGCPDMYAVIGFWSNWQEAPDQLERKLLLPPGVYSLFGGGSVYYFSSEEEAEEAYSENGLPEWTLEEIENAGLLGEPGS